jgi:integrase
MIPIAFRHGLRAAELCDLRWDQVEFKHSGSVTLSPPIPKLTAFHA